NRSHCLSPARRSPHLALHTQNPRLRGDLRTPLCRRSPPTSAAGRLPLALRVVHLRPSSPSRPPLP
ncbi:hypothetical protein Taro_021059, partial [Colocasia esculenta]|nr:hypothetical protein [Colocasia esculenta]